METNQPRLSVSSNELRQSRPLGDPFFVLRRIIGCILVLQVMLAFVVPIVLGHLAQQRAERSLQVALQGGVPEPDTGFMTDNEFKFLLGAASTIPLLTWLWLLLPKRRVNALYLHSFSSDDPTWPMRKVLCRELGTQFRVGGTRDPRRPSSWMDWFGSAIFMLRYSTPRFLNLEPGSDWKRRMCRSLADSRCAIVDITDSTPLLREQVALACHCVGLNRILFVASRSASVEEVGRQAIAMLPLKFREAATIHIAAWQPSVDSGNRTFRLHVEQFIAQLPPSTAGLKAGSLHLADELIASSETIAWQGFWRTYGYDFIAGLAVNVVLLPMYFMLPDPTLHNVVISTLFVLVFTRQLASFVDDSPLLRMKALALLTPLLFVGLFLVVAFPFTAMFYAFQTYPYSSPITVLLDENDSLHVVGSGVGLPELERRLHQASKIGFKPPSNGLHLGLFMSRPSLADEVVLQVDPQSNCVAFVGALDACRRHYKQVGVDVIGVEEPRVGRLLADCRTDGILERMPISSELKDGVDAVVELGIVEVRNRRDPSVIESVADNFAQMTTTRPGGLSVRVEYEDFSRMQLLATSIQCWSPYIRKMTLSEYNGVEEITQKLEQKIEPAPALSTSASALATVDVAGAISSAVASPKMNTQVSDRPTSMKVDVGAVDVFTQSGSAFVAAVPGGTLGDGITSATGYGDAMDRITQEILNMLAKQKVLVCWVMDQSESMEDDRIEVTTRIERVYQELSLSTAAKDDALLTAVVSYGTTTMNHTPKPTYKAEEIMAAIRSMPNDPSGAEMQCQALTFTMQTFQRMASNRKMALILVSDESGDTASNISQLEQTIGIAKGLNCKIFVLGRESVFGTPHAYMRYANEETKSNHMLQIDRGPETPWPEQLQIDGFQARMDAFPSGFGPYEQSRIARQTGGIFFMLPSPEVNLVGRQADLIYDADNMRPYLPDLSARDDYVAERDKSPMRSAVWKVICDLNPYDKTNSSRIGVQTTNFSIDRAAFATQAQNQMKRAQDMMMSLQDAQKGLESVAHLKARETSPRWRANYELIYAQTLAYQARLQEYGWYLDEFMKSPKPIKNALGPARPTNTWDIVTVKRLLKPDVTQELRDKSDELFRQIVKDHPGTPYSARAQIELNRGYGIELVEGYEDPRGTGGIKLPKF